MLITLVLLATLCMVLIIYILYYKRQINDIGKQLVFISTHDSFKFIYTQMKPKELAVLIDQCNTVLQNQRQLNQQFTRKSDAINSTIIHLSHDIRTPMTSLDGYLQLAKRSDDPKKKTHYIKLAQTRIKQMNTLVDELFLYTKLQHPDHELALEPVNVINVVNRHLFTFFDAFSRSGTEPIIDLPDAPLYVEGNEHGLERVCENIIQNYFIHGEGPLAIHCENMENTVSFYFSNVLKEDHQLDPADLFTRFYKEDRSRTKDTSGLGLSIVKSLMEKMDGSVNATIERNIFSICINLQKKKKEHPYVR